MIFESLTMWVGPNYLLQVQAGIFKDKESALAFGAQDLKLVFDEDRIVITDVNGRELDEAYEENVTLLTLEEGAVDSEELRTINDYKWTELSIPEIAKLPGSATLYMDHHTYNEASKILVSIPQN